MRKEMRILDITYWSIIFIKIISDIYSGNIDIDWATIFEDFSPSIESFFKLLFLLILMIAATFVNTLFITVLYWGFKIANRKHNKEKLNEIDLKNDHYYRDIICNLSPAALSYIDNFNLEEKDLVATLITLERKNKIQINDKIEILDNSLDNLSENEKYVFKHIENNTLKYFNMSKFEENVIKDCLENNLLEETNQKNKKIFLKIVFSILIYIGIIISFYYSPYLFNNFALNNNLVTIISLTLIFVLFFGMILFPFITIAYIKFYISMNKTNPYIRSKLGNEINYKLEGLKNYIESFTIMQTREKNDIILWEDYLIYSIIFAINTKITNEIMEKYLE